jgi:hypothetical protein
MKETYTKADLVEAWQSDEEGYQDALIDENNDCLKDEPKHD